MSEPTPTSAAAFPGDWEALVTAATDLTGRPLPPSSLPAVTAALRDLAAAIALLPAVEAISLPQAPFDPQWSIADNASEAGS